MVKQSISIVIVSMALLLTGCGKKKNDNNSENAVSNTGTAGKITVTNNVVKKSTKKTVSKENSGQFYYSYNQAGQTKESKEIDKYMKKTAHTKTELNAYSSVRKSLSPVGLIKLEQMKQRLSKNFILLCSACHSDYANGIIGPSLLGKSEEFIYKRVTDFKSGKRKNVLMKQLVDQLSKKQLKALAEEISKFNKEVQKMRMVK